MNMHGQMAECRLTYAKLVQTSAMNMYGQMAECRLTYAKLVIISVKIIAVRFFKVNEFGNPVL